MKTFLIYIILTLFQSLHAWGNGENYIIMEGSLTAAKERAGRENKLLIVEFTAKWCLPCRYMEKNVFENPEVQKFSSQYAIIFQVDIDENKNLKEEFKIEVLPTIILMRASGLILSRKEESLNANEFMNWIEKNKDIIPDIENATTKQQHDDELVVIELPTIETNDFEAEIAKQIEESKINQKDKIQAVQDISYHLQAGVFTTKLNAENMAALLKFNFQKEINITEETKENNNIYKVSIGKFSNKEEAELFKDVLKKHKFETIIRHN